MSTPEVSPQPDPPGVLLRLIRDQRVAFLVVGAINTAVAFVLFAACSETLGHSVDQRHGKILGSLVTILMSHILSVMFAFFMHRRLVFRVRGHLLRDFARFESVNLTTLGINSLLLPALVEAGMNRVLAGAILLASTTLFSWFGHRYFSFVRRVSADHDGVLPVERT